MSAQDEISPGCDMEEERTRTNDQVEELTDLSLESKTFSGHGDSAME